MKLFYLSCIFMLLSTGLLSQGCVAIRSTPGCNITYQDSIFSKKGQLIAGVNYRYFKSFRHFRGTHEEPDRVANETEVINHAHNWDFNVSYYFTDNLFGYINIPYIINTRSSLYEHGGSERYMSTSRGIGDIRIGAGYWLLNNYKNGNVSLGVNVKLPTGNFSANDIFYNVPEQGQTQVRPVDQSIQLGDGGWGVGFEFNAYHKIVKNLYAYGTFYYLANPRNTNNVRTFRETINPILQNEDIMSVPDQFGSRVGLGYHINDLHLTLGTRYEEVPVEDLIGDSDGFRRPGNVLSIEPGTSYKYKNLMFNVSVPVAIQRERPQSVTDIETSEITGEFRNGDSAFADYLINVGITFTY